MSNDHNDDRRRTVLIPGSYAVLLDIAVIILIEALFQKHGERTATAYAISGAIIAHFAVTVLNTVFANKWPHYEVRTLCATLWNEEREKQIKAALRVDIPNQALTALLSQNGTLRQFNSDDIYRAIEQMHQGAFFAAVDLWDPDKLNEDFLKTTRQSCRTDVQIKVFEYRRLVADKILRSNIIAARRYRVKALDHVAFVSDAPLAKQPMRLKSLALLALNIQFDDTNHWVVDIEFSGVDGRHYPSLDYALLFGPRSSDGNGPAYVTNDRQRLLKDKDYTGMCIWDPVLLTLLVEDRFWASKRIVQGKQFMKEVGPYLASELTRLKAEPGCASPECQAILAEVPILITA